MNEEQYEVRAIVGERIVDGKREFLVKWQDGSEQWSRDENDMWMPEEEVDCPDLIAQFRAAAANRQ